MPAFDPAAPLDRLPGESAQCNAALQDYWQQGSGRSLRALFTEYRNRTDINPALNRPPTRRMSTLQHWSMDWDWVARIDQAERNQRAAEAAAKEAAMQKAAALWAERQLTVRERDWQQAEKLRAIADGILEEAPKFKKNSRRLVKGKDGEPDKEIIVLALNGELAVKAIEASSKLQRLAAEMETDHTVNEVAVGETIDQIRDKRWAEAMAALTTILDEPEPEPQDGEPNE